MTLYGLELIVHEGTTKKENGINEESDYNSLISKSANSEYRFNLKDFNKLMELSIQGHDLTLPMQRINSESRWEDDLTYSLFHNFNEVYKSHNKLAQENEVLRERGDVDLITGLPTRLKLLEMIEGSLNSRRKEDQENTQHTYVLLDVDYFGGVNDNLGHVTGDKILGLLGKAIKENTRRADIYGRRSGEEFVMYFENTKESDIINIIKKIAESYHKKVRKNFPQNPFCGTTQKSNGRSVSYGLTFSCGIHSTDQNLTEEELFNFADKAMYKVKNNGRNNIVLSFSEPNIYDKNILERKDFYEIEDEEKDKTTYLISNSNLVEIDTNLENYKTLKMRAVKPKIKLY